MSTPPTDLCAGPREPLRSIRNQLLAWLLVPAVVLWIALLLSTIYISNELSNVAYDEELSDVARVFASHVRPDGSKLRLDLSDQSIALMTRDQVDSIWFRILGPSGELVAGDAEPFPLPPPAPGVIFSTALLHGEKSRIATMFVPLVQGGYAVTQFAETMHGRILAVQRTVSRVLVPVILMLLAGAASVWFAVRRGLRPLEAVRAQLEKRSATDLTPLPVSHRELQPLVGAVNGLLRRIDGTVATQKSFIATAAHQLRTPLAGLKTQIQSMARDGVAPLAPVELSTLGRNVDRLIGLVQKLLALARAERGREPGGGWSDESLTEIARSAAEEMAPRAIARGLEFEFDDGGRAVRLRCDAANIRELILNLLENAVLYTPAGGTVALAVHAEPDGARLVVRDTGPGIPCDERERVFERFYRIGGTGGDGSGLGLSIVRQIADEHGAAAVITDAPGGGAQIAVTFPAAGAGGLHSGMAAT